MNDPFLACVFGEAAAAAWRQRATSSKGSSVLAVAAVIVGEGGSMM